MVRFFGDPARSCVCTECLFPPHLRSLAFGNKFCSLFFLFCSYLSFLLSYLCPSIFIYSCIFLVSLIFCPLLAFLPVGSVFPYENCALLDYYAACSGNSFTTFRDNRSGHIFKSPDLNRLSRNVGKELPLHAA
jgi:hypothetical protein